jgi:hypothetical protein
LSSGFRKTAEAPPDGFLRDGTGSGRVATNPSAQPLNDRYTFDSFVIGKSNQLAAAAAHAVVEAPGKTYNPLFIYGATGLGKTHLMQAIAHSMVRTRPDTRVLYVSAEQFINEVIEGITRRTMPEFRKRYRSDIDLFLVDDVHFLESKEATQEEFFHTFNALYEGGKQIALTSDRPPKEIPGLEARLVSRFEWGMVADIGQPDLEHRIAILRKKQEQDHLEMTIPDDVLRFIAEHVRSNVRELEGCIIKLLLYASLKHREVSIELARRRWPTRSGRETTRWRHPRPCRPSTGSRTWSPGAGESRRSSCAPRPGSRPGHPAADRDVPGSRSPADAVDRDRPCLRRAGPFDGDPQRRQGSAADEPRPRFPRQDRKRSRGAGCTIGLEHRVGTVGSRGRSRDLSPASPQGPQEVDTTT